jgi:hypothetical protein
MQQIANRIRSGAMAFLKAEYSVMLGFILVVTGLMYVSGLSEQSHPLNGGSHFSLVRYFPVWLVFSACGSQLWRMSAPPTQHGGALLLPCSLPSAVVP